MNNQITLDIYTPDKKAIHKIIYGVVLPYGKTNLTIINNRAPTSLLLHQGLLKILDENKNVIFISGHTHVSPSVEFDEAHCNLYINDGSLCPTAVKNKNDKTQQGNITLLEVSENEISVIVKGIHTETDSMVFYPMS